MVDIRVGHALLRRHIRRRAYRQAGYSDRLLACRLAHGLRDTEIRDECVPAGKHHILRFHIAVHDAAAVGVVQRISELREYSRRVGDGELSFARDAVAQRLPFHVRHNEVEQPVSLARVVQGEDIGVLELRGDLDLSDEAWPSHRGGELLTQHFERDLAPMPNVLCQVDGRHAALPKLSLDAIAAPEGRGEPLFRTHWRGQ
jgi:hypothetical protein